MALKRVLDNLIDNAIRYCDGETVTIDWQCGNQEARICIEDRGPGIPEDQIQSVFQPFSRLEDSRSRSTGGTGLGLAIVKQIANQHGGEVHLTLNKEKGTCAEFILPTRAAGELAAVAEQV